MAGYKRNQEYTWRIDLGEAGYCEWKTTAKEAYRVKALLCDFFEMELPMYCDGKLV